MVPVNSYSDAAKAQDAAHDQAYRKIQRILTDKASEVHQVEALLDDAILTDNDIRKLFVSLKISPHMVSEKVC